ncbi:MAG: GH25 family lysozyme [Bacteroidota bacterium]
MVKCSKAGFYVGAYHFFTFCKSGKVQAANFISSVLCSMKSLLPVIDLEFCGNCK